MKTKIILLVLTFLSINTFAQFGADKNVPVPVTVSFTVTSTSENSVNTAFKFSNDSDLTSIEVAVDGNVVEILHGKYSGWNFTGLPSGSDFTLGIRARNFHGKYSPYTFIGAKTKADETAPVITGFSLVGKTATTLQLLFSAKDNNKVEKLELTLNGTVVASISSNLTTYTLTGLQPNTTYLVGIRAEDEAGNFSQTLMVYGTTEAVPNRISK